MEKEGGRRGASSPTCGDAMQCELSVNVGFFAGSRRAPRGPTRTSSIPPRVGWMKVPHAVAQAVVIGSAFRSRRIELTDAPPRPNHFSLTKTETTSSRGYFPSRTLFHEPKLRASAVGRWGRSDRSDRRSHRRTAGRLPHETRRNPCTRSGRLDRDHVRLRALGRSVARPRGAEPGPFHHQFLRDAG